MKAEAALLPKRGGQGAAKADAERKAKRSKNKS